MYHFIRKAKNRIKSVIYTRYYKGFSKYSYPDFLIIGALKSGTTSLYQYLNNHSGIVSSSIKETNFFSWEYHKGIKYYLNHFPLKATLNGKMVFESCPHYLADPKSPGRIKKILPNVKIIAILRDPIERGISNYNYFANPTSRFGIQKPQELDKRTVNEAFLDDLQGKEPRIFRQFCRLSLYAKQLEPYYKQFGKKNILVLDFDELKKDSKKTLEKISIFLEIDHNEFKGFENKQKKIASIDSYETIHNKELNIYNYQNYNIKIPKELTSELIDFYKSDVTKLLTITQTNFSWKDKYI